MTDEVKPRTVAAPDDLRVYAAELISRFGARGAARELGISRHAVMAVACGTPVFPGTCAMLREAMRARGVS